MPYSFGFLICLNTCVILVDQLMRVCAYIREQREKANSTVSVAVEDKEKNKKEV